VPPEVLVTTSWDDGAPQDLRLAELLAKHDLPACFYVPRFNPEHPVLDERSLAQIAGRFELGGHTMNHLRLTALPPAQARSEIRDCKPWLEDVAGRPVGSFCYPGGQFDDGHVAEVAAAGFTGARTADWLSIGRGGDPFRIAPSVHVYPHARHVHLLHGLRRRHAPELWAYLVRLGLPVRPLDLTRGLLAWALERGGVLHVWGHSWEIDQLGLWDELEAIFALLAAARDRVTFVDNTSLARRTAGAAVHG
jgi:peptidoglycan/xylan/chitin deacetylase (PgdA/CDA1 family)